MVFGHTLSLGELLESCFSLQRWNHVGCPVILAAVEVVKSTWLRALLFKMV